MKISFFTETFFEYLKVWRQRNLPSSDSKSADSTRALFLDGWVPGWSACTVAARRGRLKDGMPAPSLAFFTMPMALAMVMYSGIRNLALIFWMSQWAYQ
jgi:hypothetical protein